MQLCSSVGELTVVHFTLQYPFCATLWLAAFYGCGRFATFGLESPCQSQFKMIKTNLFSKTEKKVKR